MSRRSSEPVFWLLFAAGGVVAAMLLPALVLLTGIAGPLGWLPRGALGYDRLVQLLEAWPAKAVVFVVVSLLFWHAMHRIVHSLHDLGLRGGHDLFRLFGYGLAGVATLLTAIVLAATG